MNTVNNTQRLRWWTYIFVFNNGKQYVGITRSGVRERTNQHKWHAREYKKKGHLKFAPVDRAIAKYGEDSFVVFEMKIVMRTARGAQTLEQAMMDGLQKDGVVLYNKNRSRVNFAVVKFCSVDGCKKSYLAKGLCAFHYRRRWNDIPFDAPKGKRCRKRTVKFCSVDGCKRSYAAKGLCWHHYQRVRKRVLPNKFPDGLNQEHQVRLVMNETIKSIHAALDAGDLRRARYLLDNELAPKGSRQYEDVIVPLREDLARQGYQTPRDWKSVRVRDLVSKAVIGLDKFIADWRIKPNAHNKAIIVRLAVRHTINTRYSADDNGKGKTLDPYILALRLLEDPLQIKAAVNAAFPDYLESGLLAFINITYAD